MLGRGTLFVCSLAETSSGEDSGVNAADVPEAPTGGPWRSSDLEGFNNNPIFSSCRPPEWRQLTTDEWSRCLIAVWRPEASRKQSRMTPGGRITPARILTCIAEQVRLPRSSGSSPVRYFVPRIGCPKTVPSLMAVYWIPPGSCRVRRRGYEIFWSNIKLLHAACSTAVPDPVRLARHLRLDRCYRRRPRWHTMPAYRDVISCEKRKNAD